MHACLSSLQQHSVWRYVCHCQEARVVKRAWIANCYQPLDKPMDMIRED
jgi:hypothetical protein